MTDSSSNRRPTEVQMCMLDLDAIDRIVMPVLKARRIGTLFRAKEEKVHKEILHTGSVVYYFGSCLFVIYAGDDRTPEDIAAELLGELLPQVDGMQERWIRNGD